MNRRLSFASGLRNTAWRYLFRNRRYSLLMLIGIALGVSVVTAIDIANESAASSFELSKQAITGQSTHQILGGPQGIDENLYDTLRQAGLNIDMAPVMEAVVSIPLMGNQPFSLLGIDPFADQSILPG